MVEPKATQWIYTRDTLEGLLDQREPSSDEPLTDERWTRYDGQVTAAEETRAGRRTELFVTELDMENDGENGTEEDNGRSPRELYRLLASLPGDGRDALQVLRKENAVADDKDENQSQNDYREISDLLRAAVKPPEGLAGLYRAFATLPHLDVVDHMVEDAAGRRAVALRYSGDDTGDERVEREWLIDPETYEVLGERMTGDGETVTGWAFAAAVVDRAGERG